MAVLTSGTSHALFSALGQLRMTKISSNVRNCPRIWMAPKFLGYLLAKNVTQNKCAKIRKIANSVVRGPILMKFWHQILWSRTVLTVPSDLDKTRLGPSYGPKRVENLKLWERLLGPISRTFTQKMPNKRLRGEVLGQNLRTHQFSSKSESGSVLGPILELSSLSDMAS